MKTGSKITLVVIGVAIGIALVVYKSVVLIEGNWSFWIEVIGCAIGILALLVSGYSEIRKIRWLGLTERTETEAAGEPKPSTVRRSAPATDAITE
jgi:hypothetical protein